MSAQRSDIRPGEAGVIRHVGHTGMVRSMALFARRVAVTDDGAAPFSTQSTNVASRVGCTASPSKVTRPWFHCAIESRSAP